MDARDAPGWVAVEILGFKEETLFIEFAFWNKHFDRRL